MPLCILGPNCWTKRALKTHWVGVYITNPKFLNKICNVLIGYSAASCGDRFTIILNFLVSQKTPSVELNVFVLAG